MWGRRSRHCCGGRTYMSGGQFLVRMRNILSKKKKNQKLVSAFSRLLLFFPQTDSSLLLLRFVSELHLFLGNLFVYISYVCVWTGERSKNKPRMKMNYARLQFFFIFLSNANSNFLISLRRLHKQQAGTSLTLTFAISLS